jgi:hypothetical protein
MIVVLVNADPADKLGVVVLPSSAFRPHILGPFCVCFRLAPEPHSSAARNPGAPPSTRRSSPLREAAQAHPCGSISVGRAVRRLE